MRARLLAIDRLRADLARAFPRAVPTVTPSPRRWSTGLAPLDALLGGGLEVGRVTGCRGRPGDGLTTLSRAVAARVVADGGRVAVVDGPGALAPRDWIASDSAGAADLWMTRPRAPADALWAAEVLARSGAFAVVVADVTAAPAGQRRRAGVTLARACREGAAAMWVVDAVGAGVGVGAAVSAGPSLEVQATARALAAPRGRVVAADGLPSAANGPAPMHPASPVGHWLCVRRLDGPAGEASLPVDVDAHLAPARVLEHPPVPDRRAGATRPRRDGLSDRGRRRAG